MKKTSGLGFAVWINWVFFVIFLIVAAGAVWAILGQKDTSQNTEILAIAIVLLVTLIPAAIFLNNAILFGRISRENEPNTDPIDKKPVDQMLEEKT